MKPEQNTITKQNNEFLFKTNVNLILDITKVLNSLISESTLKINKEGLKINEYDSANVCLINIEINKYQFIDLTEKELIKEYTINIKDLYKILKENKKREVSFYYDNENNKLNLMFNNGLKSELSLIDSEKEQKYDPIIDHYTKINLSSSKLKEIIKHFNSIKENVIFETDDNIFKIFSNSEKSKTEIILNEDEIYTNKYSSRSKYSTEYLNKFLNVLFTDKIVLKFSNTYPLLIEQKTDNFKINYILAPIIDND